jgi:hypothetical protein
MNNVDSQLLESLMMISTNPNRPTQTSYAASELYFKCYFSGLYIAVGNIVC